MSWYDILADVERREQNFLITLAKGLRRGGLVVAASSIAIGGTGNCVDLFSERPNHPARIVGEASGIAAFLGVLSYVAGQGIERRRS